MKKRLFAIVLTLSMVVAMMSGCGGSADTKASDNDAEKTTAGSEAAAEVNAEEFDPNKEYTLTVWQHQSHPVRVAAWEYLRDAFMEEYPNVTVNVECVPWSDFLPKFVNSIQTHSAPDIAEFTPTTYGTAVQVDGLVPVNDVIDIIEQDVDLIDANVECFTYEGTTYGVPIGMVVTRLFYRPSMFEEAGLTEPPKTWDELLEYAEKLTIDKDGDGVPDQYGVGLMASRCDGTQNMLGAFMHAANDDVFNEAGEIKMESEGNIAALQLFKDLSKFAPDGITSWGWGEIEQNWAARKFAMYLYPSPNLSAVFENKDYDLAAAPVPTPSGELEGAYNMTFMLGMTPDCVDNGNKPAAVEFMKFIDTPENNWVMNVAQDPGLFYPSVAESFDLIADGYMNEDAWPIENYDHTEGTPSREIFDNVSAASSEASKVAYGFGVQYGTNNLNFANFYGAQVFSDMVQMCIIEDKSAEEAAAWGQKAMEEMSE